MRDRLLVVHFLWRFLEHDLVSANTDRRGALSAIGGALVGISVFLSVMIAARYQFDNFMPPGLTSMYSLDDRFLFVSASMLVMALLAVAQWDALALDERDTAVLGALPIPRRAIVRAKFTAVAVLAVGTALAWNLGPALLRFTSLPIKLPIGVTGLLLLALAQGVVTLAAGAFGFLAIFGLREGLTAVLGRRCFQAISSTLQAILIVICLSALLLLPGSYSNVAQRWMAPGRLTATALPPLWFVGLHETLAGAVIDVLPRTRPEPYRIAPERNATALYRSLWPLYRRLSMIALAALAAVSLLTIAACAWNSRRLPMPASRRARRNGPHPASRWLVAHILARSGVTQAGFWFTRQTIPRRVTHRAILAASLAVGMSLIIIAVAGQLAEPRASLTSVPLGILAAQTFLLVSLLTGFRHAAQLPAELRASTTFSLAWGGQSTAYIAGVKRAAWIWLLLPALGGLLIWHAALLGARLAVLHFGVGIALSALLIETLFVRYRRLPFVSGYIQTMEFRTHGVAYLVAMVIVSLTVAWIEQSALRTLPEYLALVTVIAGLATAVSWFDRTSPRTMAILDLDEEAPLPTQRFDLAR